MAEVSRQMEVPWPCLTSQLGTLDESHQVSEPSFLTVRQGCHGFQGPPAPGGAGGLGSRPLLCGYGAGWGGGRHN